MKRKSKIYGIAHNDADYPVVKHAVLDGKKRIVWRCPYYTRWYDMIRRCYSSSMPLKQKNYSECSVSDDWLSFTNFKEWMEKQDWKGKELDKDLLQKGNKIYGADKCVFVDSLTNTFTEDCGASRGDHLIGSSLNKALGKFESYCRNPFTKKLERFGLHETSESAHAAWKKRKHELACQLAGLQKDPRVAKSLMERYAP